MTRLDNCGRVPRQVFLTLSLLLVGCAVRQPPETALPPEVETPDTWAAAEGAAPEEVSTGWLDDFQDPLLVRVPPPSKPPSDEAPPARLTNGYSPAPARIAACRETSN